MWKLTFSHHGGHLNSLETQIIECKDKGDCLETWRMTKEDLERKGRVPFSAKCSDGSQSDKLFPKSGKP